MTIDLTDIIVALIGLLTVFISVKVVPWLKAKIGSDRFNQLTAAAAMAVQAAEKLGESEDGRLLLDVIGGKLQYALDQTNEAMLRLGVSFSSGTVRAAIEAEVYKLASGEANGGT